MNGRNLNVRYRRNVYAKTRMKVIAIIATVALALLFIAFLIVGGMLKDKVDDDRNDTGGQQTVAVDDTTLPQTDVVAVKGYGVSLSGLTAAKVSDKATEIQKVGGSNISFVVRDSNGKETYKSSLAQSMGRQSSADLIDVSDIDSRAANKGLSSSAIVPVNAFSKKDELQRATQLFYDAAICAELHREGADDVLIKLDGQKISDSNIEELLRFAAWVKDLDAETKIGVAVSLDVLEGENAEVYVGKLSEKFDFLALDLTSDKPWESNSDGNSEMQFYLIMYKMRVLLPDVSGNELSTMTEYLKKMGIENWQTVAP